MSRKFWGDFLELYMSFPCLWKTKEDCYRDRDLRAFADEELVSKLKEIYPQANRELVCKKINGFRTAFRNAHKRKTDSMKSGASSDDVVEPSLWYYKILLPTLHQTSNCPSTSTFYQDNSNDIDVDNDSINGGNFDVVSTQESRGIENVANIDDGIPPPKKKKKTQSDLLEIACEALTRTEEPQMNKYTALGAYVANSLQEINAKNPQQRIMAEKLISDVIYFANLEQLTDNTLICENQ